MKKQKVKAKVGLKARPKLRLKVKPEVFRKFIHQIEITNIDLKKASIKGFPEMVPDNFAVSNEITDSIKIANNFSGYFQISHSFRYKMVDESDPKVIIASIEFELLLTFSSDIPINKDIFDIFKILTVPLHSWPYAREFIHSTIVRLGLPPAILPLLKVG